MKPRFNIFYNEAGDGGNGGGGGAGAGAAGGAQGGAAAGGGGAAGASGGGTLFTGAGGGAEGSAGQGGAAAAGGAAGAQAQGAAQGAFDFRSLIGDDGRFVADFGQKLPDDLKEHAADFAKFKDPLSVLRSYRHGQQMLGTKADAVIIPGPDSPPDVVNRFREKMGIPATPEGYALKAPDAKDLPEGVTVDAAELGEFAKIAHEISLTPQQVAKLQQFDLERAGKSAAAVKAATMETERGELQKQGKALSDKWGNGPDYHKNLGLAQRAALTAGFTPEQLGTVQGVDGLPIFRNADVLQMLATLGGLMSEDSLARGNEGGGLSGHAQAMDIINNPENPLYKRYHAGDESVRKSVQAGLRSKPKQR